MTELQKKIEFILSKEEYAELIENGSITKNGVTHIYDPSIEYKVKGHYLDSDEISALLATKADKPIIDTNITIATTDWETDSTYSNYGYKADITIQGVTADMIADVYFNGTSAALGTLAPFCETSANTVTIYCSANDTAVTIDKVVVQ